MILTKHVPNWYLIDATNKIVGRLASNIIKYLIGKNKVIYLPHLCQGEYIIIINTDKLIFSSNKLNTKKYFYHTGFIGGLKSITAKEQLKKDSRKIMLLAIKGMLPKNKLSKKILTHVKIYKDNIYNNIAQQPKLLKI